MPSWQKIRKHIISYSTKLRNMTMEKHTEYLQAKKQFCILAVCATVNWSLIRQNLSSCYLTNYRKPHVESYLTDKVLT